MYILQITTALGQVIQHTHHDRAYLLRKASGYSDCREWSLMRGASTVKEYVNDSHLPAMLRVQAD